MVVRGTKKLLDRLGWPGPTEASSWGRLGDWYANVWFWRPQVAMFVSERALLPVIVPLAPKRLTGPQKGVEVLAAAVRVGGLMALWRSRP